MKKSLLSILACCLCGNMLMAAPTAKCWITMTSDKGGTDVIKFYQDAEYPDCQTGVNGGASSTKQWNSGNANNVNIYIPSECGDLSMLTIDELPGQPINIKTNQVSENYTFTFSKVLGTVILEDRLLHTYTTMANDGTYNFTAPKNQTIAGRFFIYKPGDFKVCTTFDHVELYDNAGTDNIVITDMTGAEVVNVAPVTPFQTIDLSAQPAGHYVLTVNGTQYEFYNKPANKQK